MAPAPSPALRVLELYCGIGGCAAALAAAGGANGEGANAEVVAAIDVSHLAVEVYRQNFPHPAQVRALEALTATELARFGADLWWLSPPCQPFTRRGLGRDLADPRTASLVSLTRRIGELRPACVGLENVPGFAGSAAHAGLRDALDRSGYQVRERLLCPTELGVPNRRRRFYLLASRRGFAAEDPAGQTPPEEAAAAPVAVAERAFRRPLAAYLDPEPAAGLSVDPLLLARYAGAIDLVDPSDPTAVTACFTAAYGRSPVRSGSYLIEDRCADGTPRRVRRFSPAEILRLLGFPAGFTLPSDLSLATAWRLVGNSLSVPAARHVLTAIASIGGGNGQRPSSPRAAASGPATPAIPSRPC
jgi:site-specific DNA-cytosine methylase